MRQCYSGSRLDSVLQQMAFCKSAVPMPVGTLVIFGASVTTVIFWKKCIRTIHRRTFYRPAVKFSFKAFASLTLEMPHFPYIKIKIHINPVKWGLPNASITSTLWYVLNLKLIFKYSRQNTHELWATSRLYI